MDNRLLEKMYLDTKKMLKENQQINNRVYNNKVRNFVIENTCLNMEKDIDFEGVKNSIAILTISVECDVDCDFNVSLNGVNVIKKDFLGKVFLTKRVYIDELNSLKIVSVLDSFSNIKIEISLYGCIESEGNKLFNTKNIGNDLYLCKNNYMSNTNDVLTITNTINNITYYNNVKYIDYNINYKINTTDKHLVSYLYIDENGKNVLKCFNGEIDLNLTNVLNMCLLSSNQENNYYNLIYIEEGLLHYLSYNSNYELIIDKQLTSLNYIKFKEVKSISSDVSIPVFWAKSQDDFWYLIKISQSSGNVVNVKEYCSCEDIYSYYFDGKFFVISLNEYGVKIEEFSSIDLMGKTNAKNYLNVDNAFVFNNLLYLLIGDVIQEVQL